MAGPLPTVSNVLILQTRPSGPTKYVTINQQDSGLPAVHRITRGERTHAHGQQYGDCWGEGGGRGLNEIKN